MPTADEFTEFGNAATKAGCSIMGLAVVVPMLLLVLAVIGVAIYSVIGGWLWVLIPAVIVFVSFWLSGNK